LSKRSTVVAFSWSIIGQYDVIHKPEVHRILQRRSRRTERRATSTGNMHRQFARERSGQTDRRTCSSQRSRYVSLKSRLVSVLVTSGDIAADRLQRSGCVSVSVLRPNVWTRFQRQNFGLDVLHICNKSLQRLPDFFLI